MFDEERRNAIALIQQSSLRHLERQLSEQLLPSIRLLANRQEDHQVQPGKSRMGGLPDLPAAWEWPEWQGYGHENEYLEKKPTPLSFLAQINLSELPCRGLDLPEGGLLYFFYDAVNQPWGFDPRDKGAFRILYYDGPTAGLSQKSPPSRLATEYVFDPCAVQFAVEMTLPDELEGIDQNDDTGEDYSELREALGGTPGAAPHYYGGTVQHRLLGHPQAIQGDMRLDSQLVSHGLYCGDESGYENSLAEYLREGARDWVLLLQIDTDEDHPGWMWGDCGRLYYWISRAALAAAHFDQAWLWLQCS